MYLDLSKVAEHGSVRLEYGVRRWRNMTIIAEHAGLPTTKVDGGDSGAGVYIGGGGGDDGRGEWW